MTSKSIVISAYVIIYNAMYMYTLSVLYHLVKNYLFKDQATPLVLKLK